MNRKKKKKWGIAELAFSTLPLLAPLSATTRWLIYSRKAVAK
jgi:hypothetical protein